MLTPNITVIRRQNAATLFQSYAEQRVADGVSPKGLEQSFATRLQISPSMWSQIKSSRPIGDKLARQIEHLSDKPVGWLDEAQTETHPSDAEKAFLDLALKAYRAGNAKDRTALRSQMKAAAGGAA